MADEAERRKLRWGMIASPRAAIEHDDKVCDWLALGACALAAFVVSNFEKWSIYVSPFWCFVMVGLLAGSAVFGLLSRILASQYLKMVSIMESVSSLMNEQNLMAVDHESKRLANLLPFWYRGYQQRQMRKGQVPLYLEMQAVRLGLYQWLFSGIQKGLMLLFVVVGFSRACVALVDML